MSLPRILRFCILSACICPNLVFAESGNPIGPQLDESAYYGKVYQLDSHREELLYHYRVNIINFGKKKIYKTEYMDRKWNVGEAAVTEYIETKSGDIVEYKINHKQTGETGSFRIANKEIIFTHTHDGTKETATHPLVKDFVVMPTLITHIQSNWKRLVKGERLLVHYGVWNRRNTLRFTIKKVKELTKDGQNLVLFRFEAKNLGIRLLMGQPLNFYFNKDTKQPYLVLGRTLPKYKRWGRWKNLNAETVISYDSNFLKKEK